jgi:hypothetical protein
MRLLKCQRWGVCDEGTADICEGEINTVHRFQGVAAHCAETHHRQSVQPVEVEGVPLDEAHAQLRIRRINGFAPPPRAAPRRSARGTGGRRGARRTGQRRQTAGEAVLLAAAAGPGAHAQGRQAAPRRRALAQLPARAARGPLARW